MTLCCSYHICESSQLSINRMRSTAKCLNPRLSSTRMSWVFFRSFSSFLSSPVWIIGYQSRNQYVSFLLFLSCSTSVTFSASFYWKYNILLFCYQWRQCFNYLFNFPDWDPTVTWRVEMIRKRLIGVHIFGVHKNKRQWFSPNQISVYVFLRVCF